MKTAQEFYGNLIAKFDVVPNGRQNGEQLCNELHRHMNDYKSVQVNDVFANAATNVLAVMVEHHSWGGSGGVDWSFQVNLWCGDVRAELYLCSVRGRGSSSQDLRQFWYSKLSEVVHKDGHFYIRFDDDQYWWKIQDYYEAWVHRDSRTGRVMVKQDCYDIQAGDKEVIHDVPRFRIHAVRDELKRKYGVEVKVLAKGNLESEVALIHVATV